MKFLMRWGDPGSLKGPCKGFQGHARVLVGVWYHPESLGHYRSLYPRIVFLIFALHKVPMSGSNVMEKAKYDAEENRVYINKEKQYFDNVPEVAWDFQVGGYQILNKWLKDRKGRVLSTEDIGHYRKVVAALYETRQIMQEIDEVIEAHGGWPLPGSVPTNAKRSTAVGLDDPAHCQSRDRSNP